MDVHDPELKISGGECERLGTRHQNYSYVSDPWYVEMPRTGMGNRGEQWSWGRSLLSALDLPGGRRPGGDVSRARGLELGLGF